MGTLFKRSRNDKTSAWIAEFTDHRGKRLQRSTKTRDKKTASQILTHWENEVALRKSGLIDPAKERIAKQQLRPIAEHIDEWVDSLKTGSRSSSHIENCRTSLEAIANHADWQSLNCLTPESVEKFSTKLRDTGRSNRTIAYYIGIAKQFARWLRRTNRLATNPLEVINKPSAKSGRVVKRRMLLPAEWPWLKAASGDRALLYETAIQTGLRANELRAIRPSRMVLDTDHPHILIPNDSTKDKNLAKQYITVDLAQRLKAIKPYSQNQFFRLPSKYNTADMIRGDLALARSAWESRPDKSDSDPTNDFLLPANHAGDSLDFHALRHTCGAWLALQGVHPKTIQAVMRHKSITLTMDTYGHLFPGAEPEAVAKMGSLFSQ